jgi:hypothetical protein
VRRALRELAAGAALVFGAVVFAVVAVVALGALWPVQAP